MTTKRHAMSARACNCFDDDNEKRKSKREREGDGGVKGLLHRIRSKFFGHSALSLSPSPLHAWLVYLEVEAYDSPR